MTGYIYMVTCSETNKVYIGQGLLMNIIEDLIGISGRHLKQRNE